MLGFLGVGAQRLVEGVALALHLALGRLAARITDGARGTTAVPDGTDEAGGVRVVGGRIVTGNPDDVPVVSNADIPVDQRLRVILGPLPCHKLDAPRIRVARIRRKGVVAQILGS